MGINARIRKRKRGDWIIDLGTIDGKRRQFTAKTESSAKEKAALKISLLEKAGGSVLDLTSNELQESARCFARIKSYKGVSLTDMVDFYILHKGASREYVTVVQVHNDQILSQINKDLRPKSISSTRNMIKGFVRKHAGANITDITRDDVERWIEYQNFKSTTTQANVIRYLSGFFAYAKKKDLIHDNPVDGIDRPKIRMKMPEYISADRVAEIMRKAPSECIARLALGFFAGIRSGELDKIGWQDINKSEKIITIRPEVAKTGVARHVTLSDNCLRWLDIGSFGFKLCPNSATFTRMMKTAGISTDWPHNCMRHTFASHHMAMYHDATKTAFELGHRQNISLLYRHYRGLTTAKEAEKYWKIKPESLGNVIRISA